MLVFGPAEAEVVPGSVIRVDVDVHPGDVLAVDVEDAAEAAAGSLTPVPRSGGCLAPGQPLDDDSVPAHCECQLSLWVTDLFDHPVVFPVFIASRSPDGAVGAENLCHQAIFMNHASGAVAPEDAEVVQVDDIIWQRAERRGLVQSPMRPMGVVEVLVLSQDGHQVALVPDQVRRRRRRLTPPRVPGP